MHEIKHFPTVLRQYTTFEAPQSKPEFAVSLGVGTKCVGSMYVCRGGVQGASKTGSGYVGVDTWISTDIRRILHLEKQSLSEHEKNILTNRLITVKYSEVAISGKVRF